MQPPLALYYGSQPSKTPMRCLFWPCAAFVCPYRLYTDASSKIYLCGGIIQIVIAGYLHKCNRYLAMKPNAGRQPLPEAEARHERTL